MGYIREPRGIDFVVGPSQRTPEDMKAIQRAIAAFRKSKENPNNAVAAYTVSRRQGKSVSKSSTLTVLIEQNPKVRKRRAKS